jgi:hypothetical protein
MYKPSPTAVMVAKTTNPFSLVKVALGCSPSRLRESKVYKYCNKKAIHAYGPKSRQIRHLEISLRPLFDSLFQSGNGLPRISDASASMGKRRHSPFPIPFPISQKYPSVIYDISNHGDHVSRMTRAVLRVIKSYDYEAPSTRPHHHHHQLR